MADLEAVLADVSYLIAMEKSKSSPLTSVSKRINLPERSVRSIMQKHLEAIKENTFEKVFDQRIGFELFKEYCLETATSPISYITFYDEILQYERLSDNLERWKLGRSIYDEHIMKELLSSSHVFSKEALQIVQDTLTLFSGQKNQPDLPSDLFTPYKTEIRQYMKNRIYDDFLDSEKFTRFLQWKYFELNMQLTSNDFSVHRIIGRGGFGEVYGCRKADTGKMYAMKCLDKKRIKMKQGEALSLNERNMLLLVSVGEGCPFIVCMAYAFQTTDKLCFILDLMNGGDLHYHLSQHGVFSETEVRFYASEIVLGLEHMHARQIVYRDLKPANILLDESGHVRISDLGLAFDYSKKKPQTSVGTHGYMAPEVISKATAYDSTADWFSFGCVIFKLLKGHSPFRRQKIREKIEYDKVYSQVITSLSDGSVSPEMKSLLAGLLAVESTVRLGTSSADGAVAVKQHPFFSALNWQHVYAQKISPPLVPPRGEVNAADAFDIGNFDEGDTKGIKLTELDQEQYGNFPVVLSERWQQEVVETVFYSVNKETDRLENKRRHKYKVESIDEKGSDLILQGMVKKLTGSFGFSTQPRFAKLYPNRLELHYEKGDKDPEVFTMECIVSIEAKESKGQRNIVLNVTNSTEPKVLLHLPDEISWNQWKSAIDQTLVMSKQHLTASGGKASKIYGITKNFPGRPSTSTDSQ